MDPRKLREAAFLFCYAKAMLSDGSIDLISSQLKMNKTAVLHAKARAETVLDKSTELDALIQQALTDYSLERIGKAELAILRLGMFEMLFDDTVPEKVALSEAIRLCRKFATANSGRLINGILDAHLQKKPAA